MHRTASGSRPFRLSSILTMLNSKVVVEEIFLPRVVHAADSFQEDFPSKYCMLILLNGTPIFHLRKNSSKCKEVTELAR